MNIMTYQLYEKTLTWNTYRATKQRFELDIIDWQSAFNNRVKSDSDPR